VTIAYYSLTIAQLATFVLTLGLTSGNPFAVPITWVFVFLGLVLAVVGASTLAMFYTSARWRAAKTGFQRRGIYRYVRHPMYTGVMTVAFGFVVAGPTVLGAIAYLTLVMITYARALVEERILTERQPEYIEYMNRTKRFIPWVV
jgi:protein-S-isoprenylcysteine O-methyltransferase Ste14